MIIQNVNAGPKAVCSVEGTVLTVEVPGVDSLAIDLQAKQADVIKTVDVSLGQDYKKLAEGVGSWYVAHIVIPPEEKEVYDTGGLDAEGKPIMAVRTLPLDMAKVVVHLWGLPEIDTTII
jgi:hypothetical protein